MIFSWKGPPGIIAGCCCDADRFALYRRQGGLANRSRERAPDDKLRVIRHLVVESSLCNGGLRFPPSLFELRRTGRPTRPRSCVLPVARPPPPPPGLTCPG